MKEVAQHAVENPTIAKIISAASIGLGGATLAELIPWVLGVIATGLGILASFMVIRAQRAIRIKTEIEISTLRRRETERLERARHSPGRRIDDSGD